MSNFILTDRKTDYLFPPSVDDWLTQDHLARFVYDTAFFYLVIVLLMNLLFGIIIDTFADLRTEKAGTRRDEGRFPHRAGHYAALPPPIAPAGSSARAATRLMAAAVA